MDKYKVNVDHQAQEALLDRIEKEKIYRKFVGAQEQGFMRMINYIYSVVDLLKQKAKISPFIEIRARIKDTNSALNNHFKEKILDDVFGIEIICANEDELKIIKEELEKTFKSTRSKKHDKANGYKAEHESYSVKGENNSEAITKWRLSEYDVPVVECQFKTIAVELNPEASHHDYKKVDRAQVQSELENKTLVIGKEIPKMWVSRENGMIELSYKEIVQRIYPFVDVTTIKEPEELSKTK